MRNNCYIVVGHLQCAMRLNLQPHVFCNFPRILLNWLSHFCLFGFNFDCLIPRLHPFDMAYVLWPILPVKTLALAPSFALVEIYWLTISLNFIVVSLLQLWLFVSCSNVRVHLVPLQWKVCGSQSMVGV